HRGQVIAKKVRHQNAASERPSCVQYECARCCELLLDDIGLWDFNVFTFDILSCGRSAFHIAYHLFQTYDLIRSFRLDTVCLLHFLYLQRYL
ncbi:hypothetical protein RRG08_035257, partial [Elysia crispata]